MSFTYFRDWFKKEPIKLDSLDEKQLTKRDMDKNPEIMDKLQQFLGPLVDEKDLNKDNGFFKKQNGSLNILRPSKAFDVIKKEWLDAQGKTASIPVENDFINIHISDKTIKQVGKDNDPNRLKNLFVPASGEKATELQEVIQSIIMEMNVKGIKVNDLIDKDLLLPMPTDKRGKTCTYTRSKLEEWMLCSDPTAKTGLCAFIDFNCPKTLEAGVQLRRELEAFFLRGTPKWIEVFDKIYNANIQSLINAVFKKKISNWSSAKFGHYRNITLNSALRATLEDYLGTYRLGGKKDNIDKSDIVLFFNETVGNEIMQEAMTAKDVDEHNLILNKAFCNKQLIGISLKKIVDSVNIMAANFNPTTTAVGDEIVPERSICIEYHGRDSKSMKLNTFGPVNTSDVIKPNKEDGKSSGVIIHINNKKHIHCNSDTIKFDIRSGGSSMKYEFREEGHPAFGNAAIPLTKPTNEGYPEIDTSIKNLLKNGCTFTEAVVQKSEEIATIFKLRPQTLAFTFGEAAGYPVKVIDKSGEVVKITNAPYLKLY